MVRVPHHDPEHGRRVMVAVRPIRRAHGPEALEGQAHRPEEDRGEDSRAARDELTSGGVLRRYVGATLLRAGKFPRPIKRHFYKRLLEAGCWHMSFFP